MLRLGAGSVEEVAVAGDTASDMETGRRAGVRLRCGVLTGADDEARLRAGGATHILPSIAGLLTLVESR
jgi:phosphoglycolate phosphatase-like HAD superfamily hydrolase